MLGVPYTARAMGGSEKAGAPPVGAVGSAEADESVIFNAEPRSHLQSLPVLLLLQEVEALALHDRSGP